MPRRVDVYQEIQLKRCHMEKMLFMTAKITNDSFSHEAKLTFIDESAQKKLKLSFKLFHSFRKIFQLIWNYFDRN
jgi:hypothetical protein